MIQVVNPKLKESWIVLNYFIFIIIVIVTLPEWLVFKKKSTFEDVGELYRYYKNKDEIVMIPVIFCSNFIYCERKLYIEDNSDWLVVYDFEFK